MSLRFLLVTAGLWNRNRSYGVCLIWSMGPFGHGSIRAKRRRRTVGLPVLSRPLVRRVGLVKARDRDAIPDYRSQSGDDLAGRDSSSIGMMGWRRAISPVPLSTRRVCDSQHYYARSRPPNRGRLSTVPNPAHYPARLSRPVRLAKCSPRWNSHNPSSGKTAPIISSGQMLCHWLPKVAPSSSVSRIPSKA